MTKILKVAYRAYICPACKHETKEQTNHMGEIYSSCSNCGNSVLYCNEPEAIAYYEGLPYESVQIFAYRFNLDKKDERVQYDDMCEHLKNMYGYSPLHTLVRHHEQMKFAIPYHGKTIKVYTHHVFSNQWITELGRLRDWEEAVYPNKKIKEGYYIVLNSKLKELRQRAIIRDEYRYTD